MVASVVDPAAFGDHSGLGFENHMNLFHENKHGLPEALARGLAVFLNTTVVDEHFRRFNGHTQVNATDLKLMKYPHRDGRIVLARTGRQLPEQLAWRHLARKHRGRASQNVGPVVDEGLFLDLPPRGIDRTAIVGLRLPCRCRPMPLIGVFAAG